MAGQTRRGILETGIASIRCFLVPHGLVWIHGQNGQSLIYLTIGGHVRFARSGVRGLECGDASPLSILPSRRSRFPIRPRAVRAASAATETGLRPDRKRHRRNGKRRSIVALQSRNRPPPLCSAGMHPRIPFFHSRRPAEPPSLQAPSPCGERVRERGAPAARRPAEPPSLKVPSPPRGRGLGRGAHQPASQSAESPPRQVPSPRGGEG